MQIKTTIIAFIAGMFGSVATAAELVHQFNGPTFNRPGYSGHVLTAEQLDKNEQLVCTHWSWSGDAFNRQVWCKRWEKRQKPYFLRS